MNRKQIGLIAGPRAMSIITAQRRSSTVLSFAFGFLLVASAESALALRPAGGAAENAYGQASANRAQAWQRRSNVTPVDYG